MRVIDRSFTLTVPSKDAVQSSRGLSGCWELGPVGVHRNVKISLRWPRRSYFRPSSTVQIFAVESSEQEASSSPPGLQQTAFTSSSWPVRQRRGVFSSLGNTWQM